MGGVVGLEVTSDHGVPVAPSAGGTVTILNQSGATLYYADNAQVSASNNQGSLAAAASATFSLQQWIRSASLTTVQVTFIDAPPPSSGGSGSPVLTGVIYVDKTGSDSNDGTSSPVLTISHAVALADATGGPCLIKVGNGTFQETVLIANLPHVIEGVAQGAQTGTRGTVIRTPNDIADGLVFLNSGANGGGFRNIGFRPFSANSTGRAVLAIGANFVHGRDFNYTNAGPPTRSVGGTFIATGHSEGCDFEGFSASGPSTFMSLGIEGDVGRFAGIRDASQVYQILDTHAFEHYRTPLTGGGIATSGVGSTVSVGVGDTRFLAATSFGVVDSEGLYWTGTTATTLTTVSRAIVGYLKAGINNSQTNAISIIPLGQGTVSAANPGITTVPSSGSVTLIDSVNGNETITYTGLTAQPDGSYTLTGATRGGGATLHPANLPCQDAAFASSLTHSANAMVIASQPGLFTAGALSGALAGNYGGGSTIEDLKSVSSVVQTAGDYIVDLWASQKFENVDVSESSNPSTWRVRSTVTAKCIFDDLTLAPQTSMLNDGSNVTFKDSSFGAGLTLSSLAYRTKFLGRNSGPITDNGIATDLGDSGVNRSSSLPATGTSPDLLTLPVWTPLVFWEGKDTDTLFAPYGASEKDMLADGGVLYTSSYVSAANALTRTPPAVIVPNLGGTPRPGFQTAQDILRPNGQAFYWIDGGLPNDQFTITATFSMDPAQAIDLYNAPSSARAWWAISGGAPQQMYVGKTGSTTFGAQAQNAENGSALGGASFSKTPQITLTAPLNGLTCNLNGTTSVTAISGTTKPTVGTMAAGRGIPPFTYVSASGGSSGAWTATLTNAATLTLTAGIVNFSDCPLNVPVAATQTANGTTASSTTVTAWAGTAITPGMAMSAADGSIPRGTYVQAYSAGTITLSQAATGSATVALTVTDGLVGTGGYYPLTPSAKCSLIWDGTNLTFLMGDNRKAQTQTITTGTASGTITGRNVTNWPNAITPTVGMAVSGPGIADGTRIQGSITGSTANWNFALNTTPVAQGAVSMTVFQPLMPRPWSSPIGRQVAASGAAGLYIATNRSPGDSSDSLMIATAPVVQRYARPYSGLPTTPQGFTTAAAPAVSIDCSTQGNAFPVGLGGVVANYTGNAWTEAGEAPSASIRNAQIAEAVSMGCLVRREKEFQGRAIPTVRGWSGTATTTGTTSAVLTLVTGTAPQIGDVVAGNGMAQPATITAVSGTGPYTLTASQNFPTGTTVTYGGGAITAINFTDLDTHWDRWHVTNYGGVAGSAAPIPYRVHQHLGYIPSALNNGGGDTVSKPNVPGLQDAAAFALFASYLSQVVTHLTTRYPTHLYSLGFMNEPENNPGNWSTATFAQCWSVISGQIAQDQGGGGLRLGGVEGEWSYNTTGQTWQTTILAQAQTDGRSMPRLFFHDYSGSRALLLENLIGLRNAAVADGFTPALALTEWDLGSASDNSQFDTTWDNLGGTFAVTQPAFFHDSAWWLSQGGVDLITSYQLGQDLASTWISGNNFYKSGLFNNQATPRLLPQGSFYALFWKHGGNTLTGVSSNWTGVKAFGSKNGNVITVTMSSLLPSAANKTRPIQFAWSNLPSGSWTWKMFRYDARDVADARPKVIGEGNQSNLPEGIELTGNGLVCIQIYT